MALAIIVGIMAAYAMYMFLTTGDNTQFLFFVAYVGLMLFFLRDKLFKRNEKKDNK